MGISEWFTIFGLLLAVYALYSSEERTILSLKLPSYSPLLLLSSVFFILFLIKWNDIVYRIKFLSFFTFSWGLKPENWALIIFLILIGYFGYMLNGVSEKTPSINLLEYYKKFLKRNFDSFYILFHKYEKKASEIKYFESYKSIIFDPIFIESNNKDGYYFMEYLDVMDIKTLRLYFLQLINDDTSIFYQEIRRNNNSTIVNQENYFLSKFIHESPSLFIKIGGLKIIKDWYLIHLQNELIKGSQSIYSQKTEQLINNLEIKFPIYLHILFIQILYTEGINQKNDIDNLSNNFKSMLSIYSNMIGKFIEGIGKANIEINDKSEYPTYYHFFISRIFNVISGWLEDFNEDENYDESLSYLRYFPACLHFCIYELINGYQNNKISLEFLKRIIHYNLLSIYYKHDLKELIREEIEKECIKNLPVELIDDIFDYSLDEKYALDFNQFKKGDFHHPGSSSGETKIISRLHNFMKDNNLIGYDD